MIKKRRSNEEWLALIASQKESGQTHKRWCETNGINYRTWTRKVSDLKERDIVNKQVISIEKTAPSASGWVKVQERSRKIENIGYVCIKIGELRITADKEYPVQMLADICKAVKA